MITAYQRCVCGAIALFTDNDDVSYHVRSTKLKQFFPDVDLRKLSRLPNSFCCNHCVNHYGVDLCGCGSGCLFGKCNEGLPECQLPMQLFGKWTRIVAEDAFV